MKIVYIVVLLFVTKLSFGQIMHKRKFSLLGSPFEITVIAQDTVQGNQYTNIAVAEVKRIENLISDWIPTTQISQVNQNAGINPKCPLEI